MDDRPGPGKRSGHRRLSVALAAVLACVAGISVIALAIERPRVKSPRSASPPNVLLIISDDQRDGTLDVMPQTRRHLAEGGRDFRRAVVTTPLCCPSRASILSGQYVHNHRVLDNSRAPRLDEAKTIAAQLSRLGYHNGYFGKYLNGWPRRRAPANFDSHQLGYGSAGGYRGHGEGRPRADDWIAGRARRFIAAREDEDERPWFLVLSARSPHGPFRVPRRHRGTPVPDRPFPPSFGKRPRSGTPESVREQAADTLRRSADRGFKRRVRSIRTRQLQLLRSLDDMVGTAFAALERAEEHNTLAIFISDNGFFWGEHGLMQKSFAYPETIEVPLLVRWPGRIEPASIDWRIAANIDIAPTIYDAVGVRPSYEADGRSLLRSWTRPWILTERWSQRGMTRGLFDPGREQYLEHFDPGGEPIEREYYDLVGDRHELENLAGTPGAPRARIRRLATELAEVADCRGEACP